MDDSKPDTPQDPPLRVGRDARGVYVSVAAMSGAPVHLTDAQVHELRGQLDAVLPKDPKDPPAGYVVRDYEEHVSGSVSRTYWRPVAELSTGPMTHGEAVAACHDHLALTTAGIREAFDLERENLLEALRDADSRLAHAQSALRSTAYERDEALAAARPTRTGTNHGDFQRLLRDMFSDIIPAAAQGVGAFVPVDMIEVTTAEDRLTALEKSTTLLARLAVGLGEGGVMLSVDSRSALLAELANALTAPGSKAGHNA